MDGTNNMKPSQFVSNKFHIGHPLTPGEVVKVSYLRKTVIEDGSEPAQVRDVRPACGCTASGGIVDGELIANFTAPYGLKPGESIQKSIIVDYVDAPTEALYIFGSMINPKIGG